MKIRYALFLCWPLWLAAQTQDPCTVITGLPPELAALQDSIDNQVNRGVVTSLSVAVSRQGRVLWRQSFGWADKEKGVRATPCTAYPIASLSKSVTATALMLLVEAGQVRLEDPVDQYLGSARLTYFRGDGAALKVGHLTNMLGGIPHQLEYFYADKQKEPLPIAEQIMRYGLIVFPPGDVFTYSNFSPAVVEQIIQTVTGQTHSAFMRERLFGPLRMTHSAVHRTELPDSAVATGYDHRGNLLVQSEFYPKGGAGYYSSVADLLQFGRLHLGEQVPGARPVLNGNSIEALHTPASPEHQGLFYAHGWGGLALGKGKMTLLSNGAIAGAASTLLLLPEQDIAIACLVNNTVGNDFTDQIAFSIAEALVPGHATALQQLFATLGPTFEDKPYTVTDSLTGTWEGTMHTYQDTLTIRMTFDPGGKIFVQLQDQMETVLNDPAISSDGLLTGRSFGALPLPETAGTPHFLQFRLKPDRNELYGSVSAQSNDPERPRFLIPAYVVLKKHPADR